MAYTTAAGAARGLPQKFLCSKHVLSSFPGVLLYSSTTIRSMTGKAFQYAKLPSLPVPKLNQTLEQYIRTVKPLLSNDEFAITEQVAKNFGAPGGVGQKLQLMLEEKGANEPNWLSEWWLDSAYLSYRLPVLVHSNPALVFPRQNFVSKEEQLTYAAKLIVGALRYKSIIDGGQLEQDYLGKSPLDMSQYTKVFNGCRIPGLKTDTIRHALDSNHIIVVHNNQFFKVVVYEENGQISDEGDIRNGLMYVTQKSSSPSVGAVGFLTTECRNVWGIAHEELNKDPVNRASLEAIEDSIFVMCLDKSSKIEENASISTRMALQLLHGYGSANNSGNRWFDKTLQLIVSEDGVNGLCYEHSPTEGPPIANLADFIVNFAKKKTLHGDGRHLTPNCEYLTFNLTPALDEAVMLAKRNVDLLVQDVQMNSFSFDKFGKEDIKALKLSPDSFIQIAIQMAFIRLHGHPAAHYESASTRRFHGGRTDTIRSCLPEIVDFANIHLKQNSPQEKYRALQTAVNAHKRYVAMAINGQAIDRHLLGLKKLAIENGIDIPSLFLDPGYSTSNNWRLSTSQVAAVSDMVMCYGPVTPDGYGCCYNPRRDAINFAVSAFNSNPTTCAEKFGYALKKCLEEMRDVAASSVSSRL